MKTEIKVGDWVVRCKDSHLTDYNDGRPSFFKVDEILKDIYNGDVCFPVSGSGTYMSDLRLATKLEKVMK